MKKLAFNIIRYIALAGYVVSIGLITYESCMNGEVSSDHSSSVGTKIADAINNINGDVSKVIPPETMTLNGASENISVGDVFTISVTTLPEDSKFQGVLYSSSDDTVAAVSPDGSVRGLSQGDVIITATNDTYSDLSVSYTLHVHNVEAESLRISLEDSAGKEGDTYILHEGDYYLMDSLIAPENTTFKTIAYSYDSSYVSVSKNGEIHALHNSGDQVVTITASCGSASDSLKVKVGSSQYTAADYTTSLNGSVTCPEGSVASEEDCWILNNGTSYTLLPELSSNTKVSRINFSSSDDAVAEVSSEGIITPKKRGEITIRMHDEYSDISKDIHLLVRNILSFGEGIFELTGHEAVKTEDKITVMNGYSYNLKVLFGQDNTFTDVTYQVKDTSVLTASANGTITPLKKGTTVLTILLDDGSEAPLSHEITAEVIGKPLIENIPDFLAKVRKVVGHYGAFLVYGIFSMMVYTMFFHKERWKFSLPGSFVQGFVLACITEIIQHFVPGRYGCFKDVMIDFGGFATSAVPIVLILLLIEVIRSRKQKAK